MMPTKSFSSNRLILRGLSLADATERYASWLNNPVVNRYLTTKSATVPELQAYINQKNLAPNTLLFGIFLKSNQQMIGTIKLERISSETKNCDIAIMIGENDCWGQGIAGEAMQLLIAYCFNELGLLEVELGVVAQNAGALKAYEKIGFKETKREIGKVKYGNEIFDQVTMKIFK